MVLEGEILAGEREYEGPFGEFTGHYSGGRSMPIIKIKRVCHRNNPIFEHLYLGMPWTEVDYMVGINTSSALPPARISPSRTTSAPHGISKLDSFDLTIL